MFKTLSTYICWKKI